MLGTSAEQLDRGRRENSASRRVQTLTWKTSPERMCSMARETATRWESGRGHRRMART